MSEYRLKIIKPELDSVITGIPYCENGLIKGVIVLQEKIKLPRTNKIVWEDRPIIL